MRAPTDAMIEEGRRGYGRKIADMSSQTPTEEPGIGAEGYCWIAMIDAALNEKESTN
ncbi:hypothetical protein [Rhizobium leguminosarum]|uniref:hypothetical protein n=1 Tax=Rhizobium leguminosarum TaxID=384 RepID=UPI0013E2B2FF|nr:hypothetical protein [Rhizobium leguminosarum]